MQNLSNSVYILRRTTSISMISLTSTNGFIEDNEKEIDKRDVEQKQQ